MALYVLLILILYKDGRILVDIRSLLMRDMFMLRVVEDFAKSNVIAVNVRSFINRRINNSLKAFALRY
jgi:hypothetical protein